MRCGKLIKRVLGAILVIVLALGLFIACAFGYCQFMHWYRHQAVYEVVVSSDSVLMDGVAVQVGSWGSLEDGMDGVKSMREVLRADSDIRKSVLRFKMTPDLPLKDFVRVGWEAHEFCRVREMEIACGEVSVPMNWACTECQRAGEGRLICLTDDKLVVYESDEAFFDEDRMAQYSHRSIDPGSVDEGALRSLLTSGRGDAGALHVYLCVPYEWTAGKLVLWCRRLMRCGFRSLYVYVDYRGEMKDIPRSFRYQALGRSLDGIRSCLRAVRTPMERHYCMRLLSRLLDRRKPDDPWDKYDVRRFFAGLASPGRGRASVVRIRPRDRRTASRVRSIITSRARNPAARTSSGGCPLTSGGILLAARC